MPDKFYIEKNNQDLPFSLKAKKNYQVKDRILEFIKEPGSNKTLTPSQIRAAYFRTYGRELTLGHININLSRLVDRDKIIRVRKGHYKINPDGEDVI